VTSDKAIVLGAYVRVQRPVDREVAEALGQAAAAGLRAVRRHGGATVPLRIVVLAQVTAELRAQQQTLWGKVSRSIDRGVLATAEAATSAQERLDNEMLRRLPKADLDDLLARQREVVRARVQLYRDGRLGLRSQLPLSQRLYRAQALSTGRLERTLRNGIILGKTAEEIARDVEKYIKPSAPGGVSYVAQRLARTEVQNAYHQAQVGAMQDNPAVRAVKWNLVREHRPDMCDILGGRTFNFDRVPEKPHPNCLCFLTPIHVGRRRFPGAVRELLRQAVA
jgi:hypothetical protein